MKEVVQTMSKKGETLKYLNIRRCWSLLGSSGGMPVAAAYLKGCDGIVPWRTIEIGNVTTRVVEHNFTDVCKVICSAIAHLHMLQNGIPRGILDLQLLMAQTSRKGNRSQSENYAR